MQGIDYSKKQVNIDDFDFVKTQYIKQSHDVKNNVITAKSHLLSTYLNDSLQESFLLTVLAIICSLFFMWVLFSY